MMRTRYVYMLFLMIALTGCIETIVMDPGEKNMPVMVNCLLTPDSDVQTLYLQYVKGKSANEYIPITEARAYVTAAFISWSDMLNFHYVEENRWESEDNPLIVTDHLFADDFNTNGQKFSDLSIAGDFDGHCLQISWPAFHNMRRMMPELPLHDEFVRIEHMDTNRFHILAGTIEYPKVGEPHQDNLVFSFVSDEYDEYLRSVYVKKSKTEHDITSIYSTESVYSNIKVGVGVFGSETKYRIGFLYK